MASKDPDTAIDRPTEEEQLADWLVGRFRDLGFPQSMASDLVDAKVDWREAKKVLDKQPPGGIAWAYYYLMPEPQEL